MNGPKKKMMWWAGLLLIGCSGPKEPTDGRDAHEATPPLFERLTTEESGIDFANELRENVGGRDNLFDYDYFYNGAGTAIADFDNDGLPDVFFCGNQSSNRLYRNLGAMEFEDISDTAGINVGKVWANGVAVVDINSDGYLDIYVSQGGPHDRAMRKNRLYVNQRNLTFRERAEDFGLDDPGISTQSVFLDYDRDGDLDCLVMNENELYGVDPVQLQTLVAATGENTYFNSSHLYRNDDGNFTDVTRESGILRPFYGLGVGVSDFNDDGWPDIYMASDYYLPDALFLNDGKGGFRDAIEEYTNHIAYFGMGMDIADANNDGLQDLFVLDMASADHVRSKTLMASMNTARFDYLVNQAGYHHQYMFNAFQLNEGAGGFSNIAQMTGMASTDWSWSVLFSDFDLDGDKDVHITNGYRRYALDNDLQRRVYEAKVRYRGAVPLEVKRELYASMPSEKLANLLYRNDGDLDFTETAESWGLGEPGFSNGAAVGDLDGDGDLDLVVNNLDATASVYRNRARELGLGHYLMVETQGPDSETLARVTVHHKGSAQLVEVRKVRGYRSSQEGVAHFGLGDHGRVDSVTVQWPDGKYQVERDVAADQTLVFDWDGAKTSAPRAESTDTWFERQSPAETGLSFTHRENPFDDFEKEILLPYKQSTMGPALARGDVNGDGRDDLYVGGASGQAGALYIQSGSGRFQERAVSAFRYDNGFEDTDAVFFDMDGDGDLDLFTVSGGNEFGRHSSLYQDRLYRNDGKGGFERVDEPALALSPKSGKSVAILDYDDDGDLDIAVGNRVVAQRYPHAEPSSLYRNDGGRFTAVTEEVAPDLQTFGIVNDILATDYDGDGQTDIIAVGEWTGIGLFHNTGGRFVRDTLLDREKGWWYSVTETDVDGNGLPDYLIGNVGLNIKFKGSPEKPFKVFANDFDDNGTPDIVLSKKYKGEYVPVRGRECSSQQMPFIKEKFQTYSEFAQADLLDIYGDKLEQSLELEATEFRSILLLNRGSYGFEKKILPNAAQTFPLTTAVIQDLDGDGLEDCILAGSIFDTEVETPRLDAVSGHVLLADGQGGYRVLDRRQSGLSLRGPVKNLTWVETGQGKLLVSAQNDGPLETFRADFSKPDNRKTGEPESR